MARAGRMCPVDYRYDPSIFDRRAEIRAEVLYVVGGLYGNAAAFDEVERLAAAERAPVTIVFNGDFHWFDAEPAWFAAIEAGVARHTTLRGNVETEIARIDDIGAGCGCAYPESVDDAAVSRSNEILRDLRTVAAETSHAPRLAALPMHVMAQVGGLRVAIVHGDAGALAGWRFDMRALDDPTNRPWLEDVGARSRVDVFASTHTCTAALRDFAFASGRLTVVNNGAAGMPNFFGTRFGLLSRIATSPCPCAPVYGMVRNGVFIDAVPIDYDSDQFPARFLARWPAGSAAHSSYFRRIVDGPNHAVAAARPAF